MKKWLMILFLAGLPLSATWADAKPSDPPSATLAVPAGDGTAILEVQGGPATATVSESGTFTIAGSAVAAPLGRRVPPVAGVIRGRGFVTGPGGAIQPVVTADGVALQAGPDLPGEVKQAIAILRAPGAPPVPPARRQGPYQPGAGAVWISSARATMAGKAEKAAFLGVATTRVTGALRSQLKLKAGLVVDMVEPKSSAETAGLHVHDIIEKCDDQWLINPAQFIGLVRMYKPGEPVTLTILREGERKKIVAKLEERETYAVDDDGNSFYTQKRMITPGYQPSPAAVHYEVTGPVQQITAGAFGAAPLAPGFVATFGDDKQQLLINIRDGCQILTANDPKGKQVFQGPIDTPEQRKLVPENVRKKLEEMEKIKVKIRTPDFGEPEIEYEPAPAR
jgi:hypothetical protein